MSLSADAWDAILELKQMLEDAGHLLPRNLEETAGVMAVVRKLLKKGSPTTQMTHELLWAVRMATLANKDVVDLLTSKGVDWHDLEEIFRLADGVVPGPAANYKPDAPTQMTQPCVVEPESVTKAREELRRNARAVRFGQPLPDGGEEE